MYGSITLLIYLPQMLYKYEGKDFPNKSRPPNIYQIQLKILPKISSKTMYVMCINILNRQFILVHFLHMHVHVPVNRNYLHKTKKLYLVKQRKIDILKF